MCQSELSSLHPLTPLPSSRFPSPHSSPLLFPPLPSLLSPPLASPPLTPLPSSRFPSPHSSPLLFPRLPSLLSPPLPSPPLTPLPSSSLPSPHSSRFPSPPLPSPPLPSPPLLSPLLPSPPLPSPPYSRIKNFLEKPEPHQTESRLASPVFYCLRRSSLQFVTAFNERVQDRRNRALGHFMVS